MIASPPSCLIAATVGLLTIVGWPVAVFGTAGGKLKADGRFIRFPIRGQTGNRALGDLWCAIATAAGVPTDSFGKGGNETVRGPLETVMA